MPQGICGTSEMQASLKIIQASRAYSGRLLHNTTMQDEHLLGVTYRFGLTYAETGIGRFHVAQPDLNWSTLLIAYGRPQHLPFCSASNDEIPDHRGPSRASGSKHRIRTISTLTVCSWVGKVSLVLS